MKRITAPLDYASPYFCASDLRERLRGFHTVSQFRCSVDIFHQYVEAVMTDEQAFLFCLQYPEYLPHFRDYA